MWKQLCFCYPASQEDFGGPLLRSHSKGAKSSREASLEHPPHSSSPLDPSASSLLGPTEEAHTPQAFSGL